MLPATKTVFPAGLRGDENTVMRDLQVQPQNADVLPVISWDHIIPYHITRERRPEEECCEVSTILLARGQIAKSFTRGQADELFRIETTWASMSMDFAPGGKRCCTSPPQESLVALALALFGPGSNALCQDEARHQRRNQTLSIFRSLGPLRWHGRRCNRRGGRRCYSSILFLQRRYTFPADRFIACALP